MKIFVLVLPKHYSSVERALQKKSIKEDRVLKRNYPIVLLTLNSNSKDTRMYRIRINLWILYYITPCIKAKFLKYMKDWWNKNNISRWFDMISPSTGLNNNMNTFDKKYSWIREILSIAMSILWKYFAF